MRNTILVFLLTFFFVAPSAFSMDKRTPISILPYKKQSIRMVYVDTHSKAKQYRPDGTQISSSKNHMAGTKFIYRNTFLQDIELGLEIPYIFSKTNKTKSISGVENKREFDDGIGDIDIQLTYQFADFRKKPFGAIAGFELKFPTGDAEQARGTGAYEMIYRGALSRKIKNFVPFVQGVYTDRFDGEVGGVDTNMGDDLYMGIGTKILFKKLFRLDIKYFYDLATSGSTRNINGNAVKYEGYDIRGYKIKGEVFVSKNVVLEAFYESTDPLGHEYYPGSSTIYKKPSCRNRLAFGATFLW